MKFDVYCDESCPDSLAAKSANAKFLVIGSLWLPRDMRMDMKDAIHRLRLGRYHGRRSCCELTLQSMHEIIRFWIAFHTFGRNTFDARG